MNPKIILILLTYCVEILDAVEGNRREHITVNVKRDILLRLRIFDFAQGVLVISSPANHALDFLLGFRLILELFHPSS